MCFGSQKSIWLGIVAKLRWRSFLHSWFIEQLPETADKHITHCHLLGTGNINENLTVRLIEASHHIMCIFVLLLIPYIYFSGSLTQSHSSIWRKEDISLSNFTQSWRSRLRFFFFFFLFFPVWGPKMLRPHWAFLLSSLDVINNGWNSHSLTCSDCLEKKTWKTIRNSARPRAPCGRQACAWPPISTNTL